MLHRSSNPVLRPLLWTIQACCLLATQYATLFAEVGFPPIPEQEEQPEWLIEAANVLPHPRQTAWQELGLTCFVHFGVNTFTDREWGDGFEDPTLFQPTDLDCEQWVLAAKAAGMRMILLTCKHHDGFCLWQTRYTEHSVASSPWRDGKGDVLRDLVDACAAHDMKVGVYLSPADLHQIESLDGLYGNLSQKTTRTIPEAVSDRAFPEGHRTFTFERIDDYNAYMLNQLYEVLTEYGPIHEVWFDGAHPKRKGGQTYNYDAWYHLSRWRPDKPEHPHSITIDFGESLSRSGFTYLPRPDDHKTGCILQYTLEVSSDGQTWQEAAEGEFDNMTNNPTYREVRFARPHDARYMRLTSRRAIRDAPFASVAELGTITE